MFLHGFGFNGYRSFGEELQVFSPLSKINILIGPNNAGKSNVIRFLKDHLGKFVQATRNAPGGALLAGDDLHKGFDGSRLRFGLALSIAQLLNDPVWMRVATALGSNSLLVELLNSVSSGEPAVVELEYELDQHGRLVLTENVHGRIQSGLSGNNWISLHRQLNHQIVVGAVASRSVTEHLFHFSFEPPPAKVIPVFRQIVLDEQFAGDDYGGRGLIKKLAELKDPDVGQEADRNRFDAINAFLSEITGVDEAYLEIPHRRDKIVVSMEGKRLSLDALGTGIHEVIILAAAATIATDTILCVEEPEIHLHPTYQRKLLRYLRDKTSNQYVITTHSAHLMDAVEDASVFHVRLENGASKVTPVITGGERSAVCADLGYRASDLVQANSVIWVEGPSDRIYLLHWLNDIAPELRENLHFSIMFYGGSLASHLTADDPNDEAVQEFISLRRLNRYIAIVIDSDKRSPHAQIGKTKKRLVEEFSKGPGFAWVTKGREIENYLKPELVSRLVAVLHPSAKRSGGSGDFEKPLAFVGKAGKSMEVDKVRLAKEVAKEAADLKVLDLEQRIKQVARFIREANDLPAA